MRLLSASAAAFATLLAAPIGTATAQDPAVPACGEMHLFQSIEDIQFIDTGAEGVDAGDRRILRWTIHDAGGNAIGTFFVLTTVLQVMEVGEAAMAEGHVVFANGDIKVSVVATLPDAANTEQSNQTPIVWSINGGTGAFAGATGTLVNGPQADNPGDLQNWTLYIFVNCL
jgi:hypothetical protein